MMGKKNIFRKFWWDGRTGHSTYLMFLLTFTNFILISYNYLLMDNTFFEDLKSDLVLFSIIFIIFYIPISILIGRWHTKTQISVDNTLRLQEDPIRAKMVKTLLDAYTGKASKEEIEEVRKFMLEIETRDIKEF